MAFKYRKRSTESVQKRSEQQGGEYQGFIKDEFKTFRPKKGDNWVRILPPTWKDTETYGDHYGIEIFTHYGVGPDRASVLCVGKMPNPETGKLGKCPICAARAKLEAAGDEAEAKELRITKRVLVWVLDKKDPDKGPLAWSMPWTLDRDIAKISIDKRTGDTYFIDHPEAGYDVTFEVEGEKQQTKYTGIQLARKKSAVDEEHLEFIAEHPLPDTLNYRSAKEVQALFEGGPEEDDDAPKKAKKRPPADDEDDDEDEPPRKKKAARRPDPDEDEDEDEDDAPPKKSVKAKKRPDPDEDDEDEDDDEDDDEDEEEAPPKKKGKPTLTKRKPAPADDDDEEEEEEEDEIPFKKGAKGKPAAKRKPAPADEDEDEDEDDDGVAAARVARLKKRLK